VENSITEGRKHRIPERNWNRIPGCRKGGREILVILNRFARPTIFAPSNCWAAAQIAQIDSIFGRQMSAEFWFVVEKVAVNVS
jgi:hypothetical protein